MRGKGKFSFSIDTLINWGASVVIIGLMFKLLNFKGGDWMIGIGLGVEALLFFILGFLSSEKDVDWTRVYPELDEHYKEAAHQGSLASRGMQPSKESSSAALDNLLQKANIDEHMLRDLGDGLRSFSEKITSLSKISETALATNQFADKLNAATVGASQLCNAFERAAADLQTFNDATEDMQQFREQLTVFNKNLISLNAIYGDMLTAMNTSRL